MFGEKAVAGFVESGINVEHVQYDAAPSGVALIFVGDDGENSIGVASGANGNLSPVDVRKAEKAFSTADVVVMQLETPLDTVQAAADSAVANGSIVILNPAPAQTLPDKLLEKVTILTPNETEAELLTGITVSDEASCNRAADILLDKGIESVIITLGARGAFVASAEERLFVPGFKVEPIDTTAAGDTFNGALAVALADGMRMADAVRFANAAGAISVTRMGAQPSAPSRSEIEMLLDRALVPSVNGETVKHEPHPHMHARQPEATAAANGRQ
jgi:ribokinase